MNIDVKLIPARTGLLIVDLQNDFLHPKGAYARGGQISGAIAALPAKVLTVANALREKRWMGYFYPVHVGTR